MKFSVGALALSLGCVVCAQEKAPVTPVMTPAAARAPRFIDAEKLDYPTLVGPPPEGGSAAAVEDLETVLNVQKARTADDVAWAKVAERDTLFNHAAVLGAWFTKENLPRTAELFAALEGDLRAIDGAMKKPFLRPRPATADARVQPCVTKPTSTSYPSGTAMQALVWAGLLAEIFPEQRDALFARAQRVGWGRVIGGVHYPSDLAAGRGVGVTVLLQLLGNGEFSAELARCKAEVEAFRAKQRAESAVAPKTG